MRRRKRVAMPLLFAAMVGVSACGGGGGASVASFCSLMKKDHDSKALDITVSADQKTADAAIKKVVSKSPSEVKPDVQTLADGVHQLASGQATIDQVATPAYAQALSRVVSYTKTNCNGLDVGNATPSDTSGDNNSPSTTAVGVSPGVTCPTDSAGNCIGNSP